MAYNKETAMTETDLSNLFYMFNELLIQSAGKAAEMSEKYKDMPEDTTDINELKGALVDDYQANSLKLALCQFVIENQEVLKDMLIETLDADEYDLAEIMTYEYENFDNSELENHRIYKMFDKEKKS